MAVFRVEKNSGYTVMSNHHLRNQELSLKAKGLLSQMLSLPDNWDYTLKGLSLINLEKIDAIREAIRELERAGYIVRSRERDEKGRLRGADYVIYELPQKPVSDLPTVEEENLICMYHHDDRRRTMTAISGALPDMDADMRQLAGQTIKKLHNMTDAAFEEAKFSMTLSDTE